VLAAGQHPRLAELLAPGRGNETVPGPASGGATDRYPDIMARVLTGLLAPGRAGCTWGG
jgi:hypothetical protein